MTTPRPAIRPGNHGRRRGPAVPTACSRPCAGLCTATGMAAAYRDHQTALGWRARQLLGDAGAADDATQEAFLRAWRACGSFDPDGGPLRHWLLVIVRNVAIDMIRARTARSRAVLVAVPEATGPAASEADRVLLRDELVAALATISDDHRGAVVGTVVLDRSYADLAGELGVPVGTVRSRVHYGLRRLRAALPDLEPAA